MEFVTVFTFLFINILALGVTMGLSPNMYRDVGDFSPISTDVIIIGGGATGAGIARDCALRGINCILLERRDIATGATGRNHGLLHSGARYAVSLDYQKTFIESCTKSGIEAVAIDPKLAQIMEPSVNPDLVGAVVVPDGSIDPFRLTASNVMDATENGAKMFTYCEVKSLIREGGKVIGVDVYDHKNRVNRKFFAPLVVNAGGIWGRICGSQNQNVPSKRCIACHGSPYQQNGD